MYTIIISYIINLLYKQIQLGVLTYIYWYLIFCEYMKRINFQNKIRYQIGYTFV